MTFSSLAVPVFAGDAYNNDTNDSLKNMKFNVTEVLSLDNTTQEQPNTLFQDENPPIIALVLRVIEFATRIIGSISIIIFIAGGFMFMFSQGDEQKLTNAKDTLKYAAIGLVITFLSFIIVLFVQSLFIESGI